MTTSQTKTKLIDLYPEDFEAISRIRQRLELTSDALTIRFAIRNLARRLSQPAASAEPASEEAKHA